MDEKKKQEKRKLKYRTTVCSGCRHNYYNFKQEGDGWNAPTSGEGCWFLDQIYRNKCSMRG